MPKLENWIIDRIYKCYNCQAIIEYKDKTSDGFRKRCPLCKKNELLIESGDCGISTIIGVKKSNTLGSLSDENLRRREKETGSHMDTSNRPWWRNSNKVDFKVLKDPQKYILTGKK